MTESKLRAVVATPLSEELRQLVLAREPRLDMVCEPELLPPMRWPGDHSGEPSFRRSKAAQADFDALVDSAEALYGIPDESPVALARTVRANPELRWVHTMAAGGGAQIRAAGLSRDELARLTLTTSAGVHAKSLAEFCLFGVLAGAKNLPRLQDQKSSRTWSDRWFMGQLSAQRVLIAGLGSIGRQAAQLFAGLGATVWGTSRSAEQIPFVDRLIAPDELAHAVGEVDAVVITLPGTVFTEHLFDKNLISRFKEGSTLVNVGRGTVIDEHALVHHLETGHIGFAALDVFAVEPLPENSRLWQLPNVLISPHTAALTRSEDRLIAELFADNATRFIDGQGLLNPINKNEFY